MRFCGNQWHYYGRLLNGSKHGREYNQLEDWVTNKAMDDFVLRCSMTAKGIGDGVRIDPEMVKDWALANQPASPWSHASVPVYEGADVTGMAAVQLDNHSYPNQPFLYIIPTQVSHRVNLIG